MQTSLGPLLTVVLLVFCSSVHAANFTFQYGDATSCGPFQVSWSGGSPPFQLILVPPFGSQRLINIPSSSFSNGKGSFSTQIPFAPDTTFLAAMSDASGFASGGTSTTLPVKAAVNGNSCNTTEPGPNFFFSADSALNQCRPYTFSQYEGAVQPVTITGLIPGGMSFELTPPTGSASFDWLANVKAGTSVVWLLSDSQGRIGGSSDVKLVGSSTDSSCIGSDSPTSLAVFPSHTTSTLPSSTSGPTSSSTPSTSAPTSAPLLASGPNVGLIAGVSIAGVVALVAVVLLIVFLRRRKSIGSYGYGVDLMDTSLGDTDDHVAAPINPYPLTMSTRGSSHTGSVAYGAHVPSASSHYLLSDHGSQAGTILTNPHSAYGGIGMVSESVPRQSYHDEPSHYPSESLGGSHPPPSVSVSSGSRSKVAMAGAQPSKPVRFILHTDLEEAIPPDEENEVVELPPQYSETRAPIRGLLPAHVPDISLTPATPSSPQPRDILR